MERVPGIDFTDGVTGRRVVIAGTGLDVWEIIDAFQQDELSFRELKEEFPWLSESELRAAFRYYELYPDEIGERLEKEQAWTPERVAALGLGSLARKYFGEEHGVELELPERGDYEPVKFE